MRFFIAAPMMLLSRPSVSRDARRNGDDAKWLGTPSLKGSGTPRQAWLAGRKFEKAACENAIANHSDYRGHWCRGLLFEYKNIAML